MNMRKVVLSVLTTLTLSTAALAQYTYDYWDHNYTVQALLGIRTGGLLPARCPVR